MPRAPTGRRRGPAQGAAPPELGRAPKAGAASPSPRGGWRSSSEGKRADEAPFPNWPEMAPAFRPPAAGLNFGCDVLGRALWSGSLGAWVPGSSLPHLLCFWVHHSTLGLWFLFCHVSEVFPVVLSMSKAQDVNILSACKRASWLQESTRSSYPILGSFPQDSC